MTRTVYMLNTRRGISSPLFTFETNDELDWYVTWKLSCSTKEAYDIMDAFEKGTTHLPIKIPKGVARINKVNV